MRVHWQNIIRNIYPEKSRRYKSQAPFLWTRGELMKRQGDTERKRIWKTVYFTVNSPLVFIAFHWNEKQSVLWYTIISCAINKEETLEIKLRITICYKLILILKKMCIYNRWNSVISKMSAVTSVSYFHLTHCDYWSYNYTSKQGFPLSKRWKPKCHGKLGTPL